MCSVVSQFVKLLILILACYVAQFAEFAFSRDPTLAQTYAIDAEKGFIGEVSIRLNKEDKWTRALKFMLTDLKWCLGWLVSSDVATPISSETEDS